LLKSEQLDAMRDHFGDREKRIDKTRPSAESNLLQLSLQSASECRGIRVFYQRRLMHEPWLQDCDGSRNHQIKWDGRMEAVPYREYTEPPPSCHPILSDGYEIRLSLVAMVRASPFSGRRDECPYTHLQEFKENCSLLIIPEMNQNTLRWKLFPFSLTKRAKTWYYRTVVRVGGDWIQLKDEFCLFFFPIPKLIPRRIQLLTFEQGDNESLGAVWARFTHLATLGPLTRLLRRC